MKDKISDKQLRKYEQFSRYQEVPVYFHNLDKKYVNGISKWLDTSTPYQLHRVKQGDTFDSLALEYYKDPSLYWIIMDFNRLHNPFDVLPQGLEIKIPTYTSIDFED